MSVANKRKKMAWPQRWGALAVSLWLPPRNAGTLAQHHVAQETKSSLEEPLSIPHAASVVQNIYIYRKVQL